MPMGTGFLGIRTVLLSFAVSAWRGIYYIAANGSDSNKGPSRTAARLRAPGMTWYSGFYWTPPIPRAIQGVMSMRCCILVLFCTVFSQGSAFAAGACPSGIPPTGNNCYFIAANGLDTNTGTDEAHPWLHAPGMSTCSGNCAKVQTALGPVGTVNAGVGLIFRGGDTWHEGNSSLSPYTGGTFKPAWKGSQPGCVYEGTVSGCFYVGTDPAWYNSSICGSSWCRPILNGDNPTSTTVLTAPISSIVVSGATATVISNLNPPQTMGGVNTIISFRNPSGTMWTDSSVVSVGPTYFVVNTTGYGTGGTVKNCSGAACGNAAVHGIATCAYQTGTTNTLLDVVGQTWYYLDGFEFTGLCSSDTNPARVGNAGFDNMIMVNGPQVANELIIKNNLYFHGWTVTNSTGANGNAVQCNAIAGGQHTAMIGVVIDGSDSDPQVCGAFQFPALDHMKDSMFRYTAQGIAIDCHDIHDNIFEYFSAPYVPGHANTLECNSDAVVSTANVYYNNIMRHFDPSFGQTGQVDLWFCPGPTPEYWFNNLMYDLNPTAGQGSWDIAGPNGYSACTHTGGMFMFNNTLVDTIQPFYGGGSDNTCGQYLTVLNEHLINSPYDSPVQYHCTPRTPDSSNVSMSDSVATSQGYTTGIHGTSFTNTCANDSTKPCAPIAASSSTVATAGSNLMSYCTKLANYTSEYAISMEAANACKYGTTDACSYNSTTHTMNCGAQTVVARPSSSAWNVGAYQFSSSLAPPPQAPINLTATPY